MCDAVRGEYCVPVPLHVSNTNIKLCCDLKKKKKVTSESKTFGLMLKVLNHWENLEMFFLFLLRWPNKCNQLYIMLWLLSLALCWNCINSK